MYTEVDAAEEAAKEEARRKAAEAGRAGSRGGEGAAHAGEDSEEPAREDTFLAIFLFIKVPVFLPRKSCSCDFTVSRLGSAGGGGVAVPFLLL